MKRRPIKPIRSEKIEKASNDAVDQYFKECQNHEDVKKAEKLLKQACLPKSTSLMKLRAKQAEHRAIKACFKIFDKYESRIKSPARRGILGKQSKTKE